MEFLRRLGNLLAGKDRRDGEAPPPSEAPRTVETPVEVQPAPKMQPELRISGHAVAAMHIVKQICEEAIAGSERSHPNLATSARWQGLKEEPADLQVAVAWATVDGSLVGLHVPGASQYAVPTLRRAILTQSLRRNLPFTSEQLCQLLEECRTQRFLLGDFDGLPALTLVSAVERFASREIMPPEMRSLLEAIRERAKWDRHAIRLFERIGQILDPLAPDHATLPDGPFTKDFSEWVNDLEDDEGEAWWALAFISDETRDKSKPSGKWLEKAREAVEAIGMAKATAGLSQLMERTTPTDYRDDSHILKGLLWSAIHMDRAAIAGEVGRFAEECYHKETYRGTRSYRHGNAAVWALSQMVGEPRAAAALFRLRAKAKQPAARKAIEKGLADLAQRGNTTLEEMEDLCLPSFGLDEESCLTAALGEARVELSVSALGIEQQWFGENGKAVKGPPAAARDEHSDALARYRRLVKDIDTAQRVQAWRLEQSWAEGRSWSFADWEQHYRAHPLRRPIVSALIWRIHEKVVMPDGGTLRNLAGEVCTFDPADPVSLWHPLDSDPQDVLAWRTRISARGLTQPIKQAHREIYVLTDAEWATRVYSNRFAAHILRQHQFKALCEARGWNYKLMGNWDGGYMPTRTLPKQNMAVEYHVEIVDEAGQHGVSPHLTSDQVRFLDAQRQPIELARIAPIVFSEVMRDVDLFVAVTSVANDPGWADGGPDGRHGGYWREWAFGELGQSATTRKELITRLLPKLSIADRLEVGERALIVQGKRQKYAIHFGSSNIQILPSNRYLCIVPDRSPKEINGIKLPFAGDSMLSTILAKAFLLVDEDKIKDETILRQL